MQISGLVFDVYDDTQGEVIRSVYPTRDSIPQLIKSAELLSREDRDRLPDAAFALVLVDEGQKLRKYACVDAGSTALSIAYFLKTAGLLPKSAQTAAANNLIEACAWFQLTPPSELAKAAGIGRALLALPIAQGTSQQVKTNLGAVRALEGDRQIVTPDQMHGKQAEATGTDLMPLSKAVSKEPPKAVVAKSASVGRLVAGHAKEDSEVLPTNAGIPGKQPARSPQMRPLAVDVSGEQYVVPREKKANTYALGERYPLDTYPQIKAAAAYFEEYGCRMPPEDRHRYCSALVKQAAKLGLELHHDIRKYGSSQYAPLVELAVARELRVQQLGDAPLERTVLDSMFEKRAELAPDAFCALLSEFDQATGLDHCYDRTVYDPYYSTYGCEKRAEQFSEVIGNDSVTADALQRLARTGASALRNTFSADFLAEFQKDPVGIFRSMPRDQKLILMRMANDTVAASSNAAGEQAA